MQRSIRDRKAVIGPKACPKWGNAQTVLLPDAWAIVAPLIEGRESGDIFAARAASVSAAFTRACQDLKPPIVDLHFHDLRHPRDSAEDKTDALDAARTMLQANHVLECRWRTRPSSGPPSIRACGRSSIDVDLSPSAPGSPDDGSVPVHY